MKALELFAGAGGMSLGLEAAGIEVIGHAEINPDARAVLAYRWPDCPLYGDVSELDGKQFIGIDLVSGGSPCQDLSVAGKRAGMTEGSLTRSSLFFEQIRIWRESEAEFCLWENVPGAFSSNKGEDFASVLSAFVGGAVTVPRDGWKRSGVAAGAAGVAAWRVLDAQWFGVPQRRRRVFVLCSRTGKCDPAEVLLESEGLRRDFAPSRKTGKDAAASIGNGAETEGSVVRSIHENDRAELRLSDVSTSLSAGGGKPGQGYAAVLAFHPTQTPISGAVAPSLVEPSEGMGVLESGAIPLDLRNATRTTEKDEQNRQGCGVGEDGDPSTKATGLFVPGVLAFNETGHERWQAEALSDPLNAHEAKEAHTIICATGERTHALTNRHDSSEDGCGRGTPIVVEQERVGALTLRPQRQSAQDAQQGFYQVSSGIPRRLTPLECERLMSWPPIRKTFTIEICPSPENTPTRVSAETRSHKGQKCVRDVGAKEEPPTVPNVGLASPTSALESESLVVLRVLLNPERGTAEILSRERRCPFRVNGAERREWSDDRGSTADFVQLAAGICSIAGKDTHTGRAASPQKRTASTHQWNGSASALVSGSEITALASDAEQFTNALRECLKFITSAPTPSTPDYAENLQILCCFVGSVICTSILGKIPSEHTYVELTNEVGWTLIPKDGKLLSDSARYRLCGNGIVSSVAYWIGMRLREAMESK